MPKATKKTKRRTIETWDLKKPDCTNGQIVFGFVHKPWWPGVVITEYVRDMKTVKPNEEWVYWYGDKKISEVEHKKLCCFKKHYRMLAFKGDKNHQEGMQKAIENCALQEGLSKKTSSAEKLEWAEKGFHIPSSAAPSPEAQKSLSTGLQSTRLTTDAISAIKTIRNLIDRDRSERVKFSNLQLPITKKVIPGTPSTKEKVVEVDMETSHGDKTEDKTAGVIEEETVVNLSIPEVTEMDIPCSSSTIEIPILADMGTLLDVITDMEISGETEEETQTDFTVPKVTEMDTPYSSTAIEIPILVDMGTLLDVITDMEISGETEEETQTDFTVPEDTEKDIPCSTSTPENPLEADMGIFLDKNGVMDIAGEVEVEMHDDLTLPKVTEMDIPCSSSTIEIPILADMGTLLDVITDMEISGETEEETQTDFTVPKDTEKDIPCSTSTPENPLEADMGIFLDKNGVMDIAGEVEVEMHDDLTLPKERDVLGPSAIEIPVVAENDDIEEMEVLGESEESVIELPVAKAAIREKKHGWDKCIACRNKDKKVMVMHPYFNGGICEECKEKLKENLFDVDVHGKKMTCTICANAGELLTCKNKICIRTFCMGCINEFCSPDAYEGFKSAAKWHCMFCREYVQADGTLILRDKWAMNIRKLFRMGNKKEEITKAMKRPMNVLSLYDNISTAYHALSMLRIKVKTYYSFEADKNAVAVSKTKFYDRIVYLDDVEKLTYDVIKGVGRVDLIVGASTFKDPRFNSTSEEDADAIYKYFYEFYRVWEIVTSVTVGPVYWIYGSVSTVPYEFIRLVNRFFDCEPYLLNVKQSPCEHYPCFYWGNIPNMSTIDRNLPKVRASITRRHLRVKRKEKEMKILMESSFRALHPEPVEMNPDTETIEDDDLKILEQEENLALPSHITDVGNLTPKQRLDVLGNVTTLSTVLNILSSLREIYETEESSETTLLP